MLILATILHGGGIAVIGIAAASAAASGLSYYLQLLGAASEFGAYAQELTELGFPQAYRTDCTLEMLLIEM